MRPRKSTSPRRARPIPRSLRPGTACVNWVFWSATIRGHIRERGWSNQALGDHLGLARMDVYHACAGRGVSAPVYLALCKMFNLDPLEYLYRVSLDVKLTGLLDEAHKEAASAP